MKNWNRTLPAKIICFIMCIITLGISVISVIGAAVLTDEGFYMRSEEYIIEDYTYDYIYEDAYNIVFYWLEHAAYQFHTNSHFYSADTTNIRYQLLSPEGHVIATNLSAQDADNSGKWQDIYLYEADIIEEELVLTYIDDTVSADRENVFTMQMYLDDKLPVNDRYALAYKVVHMAYAIRYWIYPVGIISFILCIICFVMLMCASARKPGTDKLHPGALNCVPFDVLVVAVGFVFALSFELIANVFYTGELTESVMIFGLLFFAINVFLGLCMSIAARIKQKNLFQNTLFWMGCRFLWKVWKKIKAGVKKVVKQILILFRGLPLIWRTVLIVMGIGLFDLIILIISFEDGYYVIIFWLLEHMAFALVALYAALFMRKLQEGGNALAKGDLNYQVDTKMMFWDFKQHGENLNSIAKGMACAVEERLQSERMKTELITNVSHDIKTPLTSIINYAGLISEEACESEHHKEYAEVLVRKSEHLKRLLDDLVEISKATTGNLEVELLPCEAGVLLIQAAGEFEQRCQAANLELITSQPEHTIRIMADSRRIWRVFENLMNNACKYSLTGSRVYLSLEAEGDDALFVFRNTSRTALNISPSELMERFVRGDTARSTEGNGLGLSIVRSLTELQNGKMDIIIDGDLFKVILRFPVI